MKVVLDTNVLISGVFWKGPPARILEAWVDSRFQLVISTEILEEYRRVLEEIGSRISGFDTSRILGVLGTHAEIVAAPGFRRPICTDRDDDKFLAAALAGQARYVVTGDKALLALDGFGDLDILRPATFLATLNKLS